MRTLYTLTLLCLTGIAEAQPCPFDSAEAVPDTLDPKGYYPTEIGNVWEYETRSGFRTEQFRRVEITGSFTRGDTTFFRERATYYPWKGTDTLEAKWSGTGAFAVTDSGVVSEGGNYDEIRLDAAFNTCYERGEFAELVSVDGEYDARFYLGGIGIPALKHFVMQDASWYFGYGIGYIGSSQDPNPDGGDLLTYVKVGGKEYGKPLAERFTIVSTSSEPEPALRLVPVLTSHPNPFSTAATFTVTLDEPARATLHVVDILGRTVAVLLHEEQLSAGETSLLWNSPSPGGVYIAIINVEGQSLHTLKITRTL